MDEIEESLRRRDVALRAVSRNIATEMLRKLQELDPVIVRMIRTRGPVGDDRLEQIRQQLRIVSRDLMNQVNENLTERLIDVASNSYNFYEENLVTEATRLRVGSAEPLAVNRDQLQAIVRSRPFRGRFLLQWTNSVRSNIVTKVERQIQLGVLAGEPKTKILERLEGVGGRKGTFQTSRSSLKSVIQTAVTHTNAAAAEVAMEARRDIVESVIYVTIDDSRRTDVCTRLDKTEWPINEGPRPPQHFNCRSHIRPKIIPRSARRASTN